MGWIHADTITEEPTPFGVWRRRELDELCRDRAQNKNWVKSYPHGDVERYAQGCRCDRCAGAKRAANQRYKRRRSLQGR